MIFIYHLPSVESSYCVTKFCQSIGLQTFLGKLPQIAENNQEIIFNKKFVKILNY